MEKKREKEKDKIRDRRATLRLGEGGSVSDSILGGHTDTISY